MKRSLILAAATLLAGIASSSAAVTVQGWWHLDNPPTPTTDSSGNGRNFTSAYSTHPASGGNMGALAIANGAGGPLDGTGWVSSQCIRLGVGVGGKRQSAMWGLTGAYNPPATDYGIEIWALPQDNGIAGGSGGWLFSSGQGGGVALRINAPGGGSPSYIDAYVLGTGAAIGSPANIDTNRWTHLAIVNAGGVLTFYTNGIPCGASLASGATTPSGDVYIGTPNDNQAFDGYLDEARMFTFAPGAFVTSDLLLRPPGPNIVGQPASSSVWDGGAAPFYCTASFDNSVTYQWRRGGVNVSGATSSGYVIPTVSASDNGASLSCVLSSGGLSTTSTPAVLTVVTPNAANVNAYRNAVNGEASLVAYFPTDGDTGATLTNTKDATHNGTLELGATYDGRTNRAFGQRAVLFNGDGDVQIPNNPAFAFSTGSGTVEAVIYLGSSTLEDPTILAEAWDGGPATSLYGATKDGGSILCATDTGGQLTWTVVPNLIGRRAHVAFVVQNGTNVTPYVDGQSLGTKTLANVSYSSGAPSWIGAQGSLFNVNNRWVGDIDELAIYGAALSANTIQTHYSKYLYGTNTAPPAIVSQPASKTLFIGGSPQLVVAANGTLPLSYQWTSNGVPIAGATTPTLNLIQATAAFSAAYSLTVNNAFGTTNTTPINLTFVAPPAGYASSVMTDKPMAYWRLDETSGPTTVDSAGMNNGVYSGSMTMGAGGIVPSDASVKFSGGDAQAPWSSTLNNPAGPFTAEFWIMPDDKSSPPVPLSSQYRSSSRAGYAFYQNNGGENLVADLGIVGNTGVYRFTSPRLPEPGAWSYVVLTYDGTTARFYVNGSLDGEGALVWGTDIGNNPSAPLVIGNRNGGGLAYNGRIDEVAIYNYALSAARITNHWSAIWTPAAVVTPPANITTNEWATLALTPTVTGLPNAYQWQKNNVDLVAANNPDGTAHYPNGVNSLNLVIAQAHPADSGQYRLVINNPVGGATSAAATITITADTTKPTVTRTTALGTPNAYGGPTPFLVRIDYSEAVDPTSATVPGNYVFNGSVAASFVQLSADSTKAFVSTTGLTPGQKYTVTVSGVKDQAQTANTMLPATKNVWVPTLAAGMLWDFYPGVANGIGNLTGNAYYPNAPYTNLATVNFDSTPITGGDLANNPFFGALGNNYGCSLSGWITPTVTTNYYFYIASDDASELQLSTSSDPVLAATIAVETGCCHGFQEPGNPTTSTPQLLQAGTSYFIRALQTEGAGGDYVKVAWKMQGDPTASTNLVPISSNVLKAYIPLPQPKFNAVTKSGNQVIISWTGVGILLESTDLKTWTPVPGNPSSPYPVTPTLPQKYYRVEQ